MIITRSRLRKLIFESMQNISEAEYKEKPQVGTREWEMTGPCGEPTPNRPPYIASIGRLDDAITSFMITLKDIVNEDEVPGATKLVFSKISDITGGIIGDVITDIVSGGGSIGENKSRYRLPLLLEEPGEDESTESRKVDSKPGVLDRTKIMASIMKPQNVASLKKAGEEVMLGVMNATSELYPDAKGGPGEPCYETAMTNEFSKAVKKNSESAPYAARIITIVNSFI